MGNLVGVANNVCFDYKNWYGFYLSQIKLPFNQYISDGEKLIYDYNFLVLNPKDIAIYITLPNINPNPTLDLLQYNIDYIVNNYGSENGGTIQLATKYKKDSIITITTQFNFLLPTNFKEGKNFNGKELDNTFRQISLYLRELALIYGNSIKFPINTNISNRPVPLAPPLKDDYIWIGKNNKIIQVPLIKSSDINCCEILKEELINNDSGTDGSLMIGYFNENTKLHTTVHEALTNIITEIKNISPVPKPSIEEYYLPLVNGSNGKLLWDTSVIGRIYQYPYFIEKDKALQNGLIYMDGSTYYPFENTITGVPLSRLADKLYDSHLSRYQFGGGDKSYEGTFFNLKDETVALMLTNNNIDSPMLYYENLNIIQITPYRDLNILSCNYILDLVNTNGYSSYRKISWYKSPLSNASFDQVLCGITSTIDIADGNASGWLNFDGEIISAGSYFTLNKIRVWFSVGGKGTPPSSEGADILLEVPLPINFTTELVTYMTLHTLKGSATFRLSTNDLKEGGYFTLQQGMDDKLEVYIKFGNEPPIYTRTSITIFIDKNKNPGLIAKDIATILNKHSFSIGDAQDLVFRNSNRFYYDIPDWRSIDSYRELQLQNRGNVSRDMFLDHEHKYDSYATARASIGGDVQTIPFNATEYETGIVGGYETRGSSFTVFPYIHY